MTNRHVCAALAVGLLAAAGTAHAATSPDEIYNSLGGAENGGDSFASGGPTLVNGILTRDAPTMLTGIVLNVELQRRDLGSFDVVIGNVGTARQPVSVRVLATVPDSQLTRSFKRIHVALPQPQALAARTHYYVGIRKHNGAKCTVVLGNTMDPSVLSRRPVALGAYYYNNGGQQANAGGPYEMIVELR